MSISEANTSHRIPDTISRGDGEEDTLDPLAMAAFRQTTDGGSSAFARKLIDQFIEEAESHVGTLRDAARHRDPRALKAAAHCLTGSSLMMGARRLGGLCARLENDMKAASHAASAAAGSLVAAIDRELIQVRKAFAAEWHLAQAPNPERSITRL